MFPPHLLATERIGHRVEIASKKRLLEVLSDLLASDDTSLNPETVFEHLLERERLGSTGLSHGIALPHARMKEITEARGAVVLLQENVEFDAIDEQPVDLAFALLVPESANETHLQLLSSLATMFSDADFRATLRNCASAQQMMDLFLDWEQTTDPT